MSGTPGPPRARESEDQQRDRAPRFEQDPVAILARLQRDGLLLTPVEYDALLSLNVAALRQFVRTVDGRLQKFHLGKPAGERT